MKALILVAHGSRRKVSNIEVIQIATRLAGQVKDNYMHVGHAFLELASPSIPEAIEDAIMKGAEEVVILPYFLSAGRHVHEDVPSLVLQKQKLPPDIKISLAPYLGGSSDIIKLLASISSLY